MNSVLFIISVLIIIVILLLLSIIFCKKYENFQNSSKKGAVLVVASNPDGPCIRHEGCKIYEFFHQVWETYMNLFPNIDVFFVYCNPDQSQDIIVSQNKIYVKCEESFTPGIMIKTVEALKYLYNLGKYSVFLRTNLSSFLNLYKFNELIIQYGNINEPIYAGSVFHATEEPYGKITWPSGICIILNKTALKEFLKIWKHALKNPHKYPLLQARATKTKT